MPTKEEIKFTEEELEKISEFRQKYLDTQKEWTMSSNETHSFIKGIFKKNELGGEGRKEDKRCFFIKKEALEVILWHRK